MTTPLIDTLRAKIGTTIRTSSGDLVTLTAANAWTSSDGTIERVYVTLDHPKLIRGVYFPVRGNARATHETALGPVHVEMGRFATSHRKRAEADEIIASFFG